MPCDPSLARRRPGAPAGAVRPPLSERLDRAQRVLCDVDGCLISGARALPGARDLVEKWGHKLVLVTNNSTDTAASLAFRLAALGLSVPASRIFAAGEVAVAKIAEARPGARVFALATPDILRACTRAGLAVTSDEAAAEVLLVCRDTGLTFARLEAAVRIAARGVPVVLANRDLSHPGPEGPAVETGSLYALISGITAPDLWMEVGKPQRPLVDAALGPCPAEAALFIGDNPATDLAGAEACGIPCALVGTDVRALGPTLAAALGGDAE